MSNINWLNIEADTIANEYYRKVIFTSGNQQLVLMSIKPKDDIPKEIHPDNDQFIRIEKGNGVLYAGPNDEDSYQLLDGVAVTIPANTWHHVVNTSESEPLKLYTIYSPPHHERNTMQLDKPESEKCQVVTTTQTAANQTGGLRRTKYPRLY